MNELNKFLKFAKDIVVKPDSDIENKIINKIKNLSDEDKAVLDDGFMDFLKKYNSRLYLFKKKLKENCGLIVLFSLLGIGTSVFLLIEYKNYRKKIKNKWKKFKKIIYIIFKSSKTGARIIKLKNRMTFYKIQNKKLKNK